MVLRWPLAANPGDAKLLFHIHNNGREEQVLAGLRIGICQQLIEEAQAVATRGEWACRWSNADQPNNSPP